MSADGRLNTPQEPERQPRTRNGFTLLETIISILILSIGFLGLAQLMAVAVHQNSFARHNTASVNLAQAKLEELRTIYNQTLLDGSTSSELSAGSHGPVTETVTAPEHTGQASLQYVISWEIADLAASQKSVTVTARPAQQNPLETKIVTVTSYFAP